MVILSTLESFQTHIVTSPLTSLCSFCNSCFDLLILATEPVSNTQGLLWTLVKYTSITCISYIYFCSLCHPSYPPSILGQFHFQWPFPLQQKHSVSGLGPALGFFMGAATCLPFFLKFPFFPFALFLKLVILLTINNWCSFLISTFAASNIVNTSRIILFIPDML